MQMLSVGCPNCNLTRVQKYVLFDSRHRLLTKRMTALFIAHCVVPNAIGQKHALLALFSVAGYDMQGVLPSY